MSRDQNILIYKDRTKQKYFCRVCICKSLKIYTEIIAIFCEDTIDGIKGCCCYLTEPRSRCFDFDNTCCEIVLSETICRVCEVIKSQPQCDSCKIAQNMKKIPKEMK